MVSDAVVSSQGFQDVSVFWSTEVTQSFFCTKAKNTQLGSVEYNQVGAILGAGNR